MSLFLTAQFLSFQKDPLMVELEKNQQELEESLNKLSDSIEAIEN